MADPTSARPAASLDELKKKLAAAHINPSNDFILSAAARINGFGLSPGDSLYLESFYKIMYDLGVNKRNLPVNPQPWKDAGYMFLSAGRMMLDVGQREGVLAPYYADLIDDVDRETPGFGTREVPLSDVSSLERMQKTTALLFKRDADAAPEQKALAWNALDKLPAKFATNGFIGFAAHVAVALARRPGVAVDAAQEHYQNAARWADELTDTANMSNIIRAPETPAPSGGSGGRDVSRFPIRSMYTQIPLGNGMYLRHCAM